MADDRMQRLFAVLDDEALEPRPEFVASLRRTVQAVASGEPVGATGVLTDPGSLSVSSVDQLDDPQGEAIMVMLDEPATEGRSSPDRRVFAGAVAVAAALLIAAGLWALVANDSDDPVTTAAVPVEGIDGDPAAAEAFEVIADSYAAYNAGDMAPWTEATWGGTLDPGPADYHAALAAAGSSIDVDGCTSRGFGDWPDIANRGPATGYRFTCDLTENIPFYEAAGIDLTIVQDWVAADGRVVAHTSNETVFGTWLRFNDEFRDWMRDTHPDVYVGMRFLGLTTHFPSAESMDTALEYVDEFVEASPDWPEPSP